MSASERTVMIMLKSRVWRTVVLCYMFTASFVCASPLESTESGGQGSQLLRGEEAAEHFPDTLTGKPIPYNWGFSAITDSLVTDAERYEDELSALFDGDLSDWQLIPRVRWLPLPCTKAQE